jgi:hypothetical protein
MSSRLIEIPRREYPQTWWLLDVVESELRLLGSEVVDLSPGAIELRHVARELRAWGDRRDNWVRVGDESPLGGLPERHRRALSFGPQVDYLVEHDEMLRLHEGRPFRHLRIRNDRRPLTPATSVEIGLYFFGRRPAGFAYTAAGTAHGFVGLDWEALDESDVQRLARREMASGAE